MYESDPEHQATTKRQEIEASAQRDAHLRRCPSLPPALDSTFDCQSDPAEAASARLEQLLQHCRCHTSLNAGAPRDRAIQSIEEADYGGVQLVEKASESHHQAALSRERFRQVRL